MITSGLFITDTHWQQDVEHHPSYLAVKSFAKYFKPDIVVHGGDLGEWEFLQKLNQSNLKILSSQTFRKEYDVIEREIDFWRGVVRKELFVLLGNHDDRIYKAMELDPRLEGIIDWEENIDLTDIYFAKYTREEQPVRIGVPYFCHGWYTTKYHANKHLDSFSGNIIYGHVHKFQQASKILHAAGEEIQAWSVGCLRDRNPVWIKGPNEWQNGFGIFYLDGKKSFNFYPVNIINGAFITPWGEVWDYRFGRRTSN